MLKRWFPMVGAAALAVVLMSAGTSRAQMGGIWGGWGTMSPWTGTGGWTYWPGGIGINYIGRNYGFGNMPYGGYGWGLYPGYGGYGFGGFVNSMYGIPSSMAVSPMSYVAFYPPVYTTRAPVVAPAAGLLPSDRPATIEVIAPADAVVVFDGHRTSQMGTHRIFTTPDLIKGESYHYTVECTFTQDGKTLTESQRVPVYAGAYVSITFPKQKK